MQFEELCEFLIANNSLLCVYVFGTLGYKTKLCTKTLFEN